MKVGDSSFNMLRRLSFCRCRIFNCAKSILGFNLTYDGIFGQRKEVKNETFKFYRVGSVRFNLLAGGIEIGDFFVGKMKW